jgi:Ca-activated chloride channel family protein
MSRAAIVALSLLLSAGYATAQEELKFSDTVSVGYVMVPFTVLGQHGAPVTDLLANEVQLLVDGQPVRSDMFERSMNAPVSFTILLDGSGSMGLAGKLEGARAAVATLSAHRLPGDDFSLFVFDDREAREVVPFTGDIAKIAAAMQKVKPFGKTAFFDALATMPERSELGRNATRAIILLSDGIDNASHLTRAQLAARLEGVAIPIYPLGLRPSAEAPRAETGSSSEELSDLRLLDEIARITGGKLFVGDQPGQLSAAVDAIETNLRAQYLVGFAPTGKGAVKYRRISLRLDGRARSVRVRAGYKGTEPPLAGADKSERKKS